ncbi:MAG: undecaprenyl-diphosphate phosphatase [Thermodesulfobacteriota bacterium]
MSDLWTAVLLGIVEGATEFLPVSSTGHLIVAGELLNFSGPKAASFEIFIQLGAILAVVVLYWRRFLGLIPLGSSASGRGQGFYGFRGLVLLGLTTLPALVVGLVIHRFIKEHLFTPLTVAIALATGAIAILLAERLKPRPSVGTLDQLGYGTALTIGLFQCVSMWPGISRAAATIVGGMISGLDRRVATEYSFLAAVPVMIAATSYDMYKAWNHLSVSDFWFFAVGFVVSFAVAAAAVKTFIRLVQRWTLAPYAYYRLAIAPIIYAVLR